MSQTWAYRIESWADLPGAIVANERAGAELPHYETAIVAAEIVGRVLVIECGTATLDAWATLVRAAPQRPSVLVIVPRGGVHPLPTARGAAH
jgi:hypothetical protein